MPPILGGVKNGRLSEAVKLETGLTTMSCFCGNQHAPRLELGAEEYAQAVMNTKGPSVESAYLPF